MNFIGDYFALAMVLVLFLFFIDSKSSLRHMASSGKLFITALLMTAVTAVTDLYTGYLLVQENVPQWVNMFANTMYFITAVMTTSVLALYMFRKILEHTHHRHCMNRAYIGLSVIFAIYLILVLANLKNKWLFYFTEDGVYCRGPLNGLGYIAASLQLALVLLCFVRNRKTASTTMHRVLFMISPVIPLCVVVHYIDPDIMLNCFVIALVAMVLFLTFQGQRHGVHSLTQLNDRHRFFIEADYRISTGEPFQIFLINIKNYGSINQKYGNRFGDEILYQFAFSLEKLLQGSMTFHMNGTVFAVVLRYTYQNMSEKQCGILLDFLEKGIQCGEHHVDIDYIVAHYITHGEEENATDLYETMEYAISKAYGMNRKYTQCGLEESHQVKRKRYLIEKLQTIDREHGFELWFQPVKCLATGRFSSMEALIRLRDFDGNLISPGEFIPLAEQTGLISPITWFVLEEACRVMRTHPDLDDISVSINVPQTQLLEKGFVPRFTGIVAQAGVDPKRICIEFTERSLLDNFRQTLNVMEELVEKGFRFYLDDFGVSYSNFNCLLQLPFSVIKLDPCLVHPDKNGIKSYTTLHTLTKLFHEMELTVVAEGAENEEEVRLLTEQGVDRIQGFALARPMPLDKLIDFYRSVDRKQDQESYY